jgi:hypothetical protein
MATTEYSRLRLKRATQAGVEPTVPTGSTFDNTWLATDIFLGEMFVNTADDRLWVRTGNGIQEIAVSGFSSSNYYTTDAYILSGNTIGFDRFDGTGTTLEYTLDLDPILSGGSGNFYVTGGTYNSGTLTLTRNDATDITVTGFTGGASGDYLPLSGGTMEGDITMSAGTQIDSTENTNTIDLDYVGSGSLLLSTDGVTNQSFLGLGTTDATLSSTGATSIISNSVNNSVSVNNGTGISEYFATIGHEFTASGTTALDLKDNVDLVANTDFTFNAGSNITGGVNGTEFQLLDNQTGNVGIASVTQSAAMLLTTQNSTINQGAYSSAIIGGATHKIGTGGINNVILGGNNNTILGGRQNVTILGGSNITATTENCAYVSQFNIDAPLTNDAVYSLGIDANGFVVQDTAVSGITGDIITGATQSNANGGTLSFLSPDNTLTITGVTGGAAMDLSFAISDETTAITSGTTKLTVFAPYDFTLSNVYASLSTSGSTDSVFDINKNGTSILSTKITIDSGDEHSSDAGTPPVISTSSFSAFDKITIDIDTAGTDATGAKIYLVGNRD